MDELDIGDFNIPDLQVGETVLQSTETENVNDIKAEGHDRDLEKYEKQ
jgi:hypothetical protein